MTTPIYALAFICVNCEIHCFGTNGIFNHFGHGVWGDEGILIAGIYYKQISNVDEQFFGGY